MHWGKLQRECHRLLEEVFDTRSSGYKWLKENHGLIHFSELKYPQDKEKLEEIYRQLYVKSLSE